MTNISIPIPPEALLLRDRSAEWLAERTTYIGATDVSAILGLHPYRSAHSVYLDKMGLSPETDINQAIVHGLNLELYVARLYARVTGRRIHKSGLRRMRGKPHLACNPDYEIRAERPLRLLECKTAGYYAGQIFGSESDAMPDQYLIQAMWQLAVTNRAICDLAVLIGGQDYRIYTVERDEELIASLIRQANDWWETYILSETPPPLSGHPADSAWIKEQYPQSFSCEIRATPEIEELCASLAQTKSTAKLIGAEQARIENEIKMYMADADRLDLGNLGHITWRTNARDVRVFKANIKEVA